MVEISKKLKYRIDNSGEKNPRNELFEHIHVYNEDIEYSWYRQGHNTHDKNSGCLGLNQLPNSAKKTLKKKGVSKDYFDKFALYNNYGSIMSTPLVNNANMILSFSLISNEINVESLPMTSNNSFISQTPLLPNQGSWMITPLNNTQKGVLICIGVGLVIVVALALIPATGGASLLLLGA